MNKKHKGPEKIFCEGCTLFKEKGNTDNRPDI